jgi:hypothetical protein
MKSQIINDGQIYLSEKGFGPFDYVVSLQGPTFIFSIQGNDKLTEEIRKNLENIGIIIL